jgi:prophage regulatory protein
MEVVGAAEISRMLGGLSRQRVSQLTSEADFPEQLEDLAMGRIWRYADVKAWAQRHGRAITPLTKGAAD